MTAPPPQSCRSTEQAERQLQRLADDWIDLLESVGRVFDRLSERQSRLGRTSRD